MYIVRQYRKIHTKIGKNEFFKVSRSDLLLKMTTTLYLHLFHVICTFHVISFRFCSNFTKSACPTTG